MKTFSTRIIFSAPTLPYDNNFGYSCLIFPCFLNGNIFFLEQVETLCNYHVGETVLSLQKATLIPGGSESLVFTTLSGGIGMLVPFTSREVQHPSIRHLFVIYLSCLFCLFIFFLFSFLFVTTQKNAVFTSYEVDREFLLAESVRGLCLVASFIKVSR